jgi:hypothetical protein
MGASGRGLGGHPRRGPPPGTRYLPGVYASLFGEERLLSMLLSHERARLSLKPCVFPVRVDDLLGKAARGGVVEQGDEPRPPPLASAPRCPPSPPPCAGLGCRDHEPRPLPSPSRLVRRGARGCTAYRLRAGGLRRSADRRQDAIDSKAERGPGVQWVVLRPERTQISNYSGLWALLAIEQKNPLRPRYLMHCNQYQ